MADVAGAREHLYNVASDDMPVTPDEVNEAIDAYVHELAEKLREAGGNPPHHCSDRSRYTYNWHAKRNASILEGMCRTNETP